MEICVWEEEWGIRGREGGYDFRVNDLIFADRILQRVIEGLKDSKTRDEKAYADLESLVNLQNTTTEKQSDLNKKVKQFIDRAEKLKKKQNEAFEFIDGLAHYLRCEIFRTRHSKDENVSIEQFLEQADNSELPDKKLLLSMILWEETRNLWKITTLWMNKHTA